MPEKLTFLQAFRRFQRLGFEVTWADWCVLFSHPSGEPTVILPFYHPGEKLSADHLEMIRSRLKAAGIDWDTGTCAPSEIDVLKKEVKEMKDEMRKMHYRILELEGKLHHFNQSRF